MLSLIQSITIFVVVILSSLAFTLAINRVWKHEKRIANNELIGWQLSVVGTTYAVVLGFMLYTVWTEFVTAELNVDLEASSLRNVHRLSEGLPEPQATELRTEAENYARAVITKDWPDMENQNIPEESHNINQQMWKTLMSIKTTTPAQNLAEDHAVFELTTMTEYRRTRLIEAKQKLPVILWAVLIVGGIITIGSSAMFGSSTPRLHAAQVVTLTMLITLILLAISDINLPFQGWVHVSDYAFVRAREYMAKDY